VLSLAASALDRSAKLSSWTALYERKFRSSLTAEDTRRSPERPGLEPWCLDATPHIKRSRANGLQCYWEGQVMRANSAVALPSWLTDRSAIV
jgi:hypothetical protein